jgi:uncharacterized protein (DUF433 family)
MNYKNYIERSPDILMGKPVIKGTRISVELIMRKLAEGYTVEDLLKSYPHISKTQIQAVFEYTADMIANEITME